YFALAACCPALAQQSGSAPDAPSWWIHWVVTLLGVAMAGRLAAQAFDRRYVPVADLPTLPKYMTNPSQYRFGSWIFIIFACGFFFLLIQDQQEVIATLDVFKEW